MTYIVQELFFKTFESKSKFLGDPAFQKLIREVQTRQRLKFVKLKFKQARGKFL